MENRIDVLLLLFGPSRGWSNQDSIKIRITRGSSIGELRHKIKTEILRALPDNSRDFEILERSVFADKSRIFNEDELITSDCTLAIFPPVCGG